MNEIKCASLMVGDWIMDEHGFPMQIVMVGEDYCYANFEGNEGDPWEFDDKDYPCYGITIAEEIVKQLGFIKVKYGCEEEYDLNLSNGLFPVILKYKEGLLKFSTDPFVLPKAPIHYLHELQHLMRCNGLAEKADSIKI